MAALSSEALKKLHHVEPQSLAFLTEVGLDASAHPLLVAQLDRIIKKLFDALPKTLDQWRRGVDLRGLKDVRVDHLGSVGTRLMLGKAKIPPPDEDFIARASASFPRGPSGDFSRRRSSMPQLADNTPQQRRIFAYAEFAFERPGALEGQGSPRAPVEGRMLREHGFQGLRMWQKGWLKAVTLPVNAHVDRSVCAEFQVLNELCDLVHQSGLADSMEECHWVLGLARVLVSTTPCLSCVCAVLQYSLLFPKVRLEFGCVQPWHSEGGANGAMREAPWTEGSGGSERLRPAVWEGGRIVTDIGGPPPEWAPARATPVEPTEPLTGTELEVLRGACSVKLGGGHAASVDLGAASSWADVRSALELCSPNALAEVLRGHRRAVRPETQPERVEKVLALLREVLLRVHAERQEEPGCSGSPPVATSRSASLGARRGAKRLGVRWRVGG